MTAGRVACACLALAFMSNAGVGAQMPDPRQMSGIPMPTTDVPAGTIVVRVIRGSLDNNVANQPVELHVGGQVLTATTDEGGRATFSGVAPGSDAHAVAVVDNERLESSHLELGPTGGIRVMLVAGVGAGGVPAAGADAGVPAVAGDVTFGGDSRIQIEFDDDQLEVFYLFDVVNRGTTPIMPKAELVFDLPEDAATAAMLEGSSTQAAVRGQRVSITGPFAPGSTPVRVAFGLAGASADRVIRQTLPATWERVQVIVTQVGAVRVASEQLSSTNVVPNEGHSFVMGSGPVLPAGTELRLALAGLPHRSRAGRWVAIFVAFVVLVIGAWAAYGGRAPSALDARRTQLEARRQRVMGDLVTLEEQHRQGRVDDPRYAPRREELMAQLDRVYGELDRRGGPAGVD